MKQQNQSDPLPDYKNPPVIETILGVQFDRLPGFRNAHLGAFWKALGSEEWPTVSDAPPLQPQFEQFGESARWAKAGSQVTLAPVQSTRLQIKNRDGDRMIQIQNGRLHFNWLGEKKGDYPRYPMVREGFLRALQLFMDFLTEANAGEFHPNQWEVTYLNHIPRGTVWQTPADWGFFRPLGSLPTIERVGCTESFDGEWHFVIPERRGRLHVQWLHALKASGDHDGEIIRLTLTARGPVQANADVVRRILVGVDLGRETIVRSFRNLMSDQANSYWGLENAND